MSKTFTPIHSDKPEERFVVEKATMEKPVTHDYIHNNHYVDALNKYNEHLASRTKYPFTALTKDMPDELIEGVDFELDYQFKRNDEGNDRWRSVTEYSYIRETFLDKRIIAVPISVKTKPTPSVEKKKKVLKSESIPEFDEGLTSMTEEQKARVDASMGLSMEDVLNQAITEEQQRMLLEDTFVIHRHNGIEYRTILERVVLSAMQHWASIKCAEKDREIDELKRDKLYWQLEASAKNKELATKETDIEHLKKINRLACNDIDTIHSQKEESVKELVELLDRIAGSMALERAERFDLNNSAKYLITKHKTP